MRKEESATVKTKMTVRMVSSSNHDGDAEQEQESWVVSIMLAGR
jgi:hypothetical protein